MKSPKTDSLNVHGMIWNDVKRVVTAGETAPLESSP